MISVTDALDALFDLVVKTPTEYVPLQQAAGRTLSQPVHARRSQPPFAASAMDGYGVTQTDPSVGDTWQVVGEAAAGHGFSDTIEPHQAIRIFTGAPVPDSVKRVIIQEDVKRSSSEITLTTAPGEGLNIRPAGGDFSVGDSLSAPRILRPADIALLASMNISAVPVARQPSVALIATGDELVTPGGDPGPDQIMASNSYGLHALLAQAGARPRLLPIARDTRSSLGQAFDLACDADVIVTIGGASVGDHDLVASAAQDAGMDQTFYKVAMRPGKPLMAGHIGGTPLIGLPGNPVSAMVCGQIFLVPFIHAILGHAAKPAPRSQARLAAPLAANGLREHYLRAVIGPDGVTAFSKQDSSLLSVLSEANCLIVQPPGHPGGSIGTLVDVIAI